MPSSVIPVILLCSKENIFPVCPRIAFLFRMSWKDYNSHVKDCPTCKQTMKVMEVMEKGWRWFRRTGQVSEGNAG